MLFFRTVLLLFCVYAFQTAGAQSRKVINVPNIPGYQTLKCDFHLHTVFSDGTVWPTVRVEEAWAEGLDAIAITDHIEYRPHSVNIVADHNRSYEIAEPLSKELKIILVKGAEITREMPPGHLNALFIKNANLLERENENDALREARDQGAFIIWNHPCWERQQPDSVLWWKEHTALFRNNMLHGIEVYNDKFCPEALQWAKEKKLTMFANTDAHGPIMESPHRPMTLVFARSRTLGGIKEALFGKRTVAYFNNTLVGEANYLNQLFFASLEYEKAPLRLTSELSKTIFVKNNSDINYQLELAQPGIGFDAPEFIDLPAHRIVPIELRGNSNETALMKKLDIYYEVKNLMVGNGDNLVVTFSFQNN